MSDAAVNAVGALLAQELALLRQFNDVLLREQQILQSGKADELNEVLPQKADMAARLGALLEQRERTLAVIGLPAGRDGMERWLAAGVSSAVDSALHQQQWSELLDLAEKARVNHQLNGKLIAMQLAQTQQALTALVTAGGQTLTYGPDGQQRLGIGGGRTLGSA